MSSTRYSASYIYTYLPSVRYYSKGFHGNMQTAGDISIYTSIFAVCCVYVVRTNVDTKTFPHSNPCDRIVVYYFIL